MIWKLIGFLIQQSSPREKTIPIIKRILIINTQGIGDFVMLTPLIHELSKKYVVDVYTLKRAVSDIAPKNCGLLFVKNPLFDWFKLSKRNYDFAYLGFGAGPRSALFFRLLRAKYKVSHIYSLGGFKTAFGANHVLKPTSKMHRVQEHLKVLSVLDLKKPKNARYKIRSKIDKQLISSFRKTNKLYGKKLIGIHPGGDKHNKKKRFPVEKYIELSKLLTKEIVLYFLGPDEVDLEEYISKNKRDSDIIVKTSLNNIISILSTCDVLIHSDSALGHLAAAVGTKTVTIAGATNWHRTRPYSRKDVLIKVKNQKEPVEREMGVGNISDFDFSKVEIKKLKNLLI